MRKRMKTNQIRQAEMRVWRKMLEDESIPLTDIITTLVTLAMKGNPLAHEEIDRVSRTDLWKPVDDIKLLTVRDGALIWIHKPQEAP